MQEIDEAKPLLHAMHLDVSVAREHVRVRREAALAAGGRIVDESMHRHIGHSLTARATACAFARGQMGPL